MKFSIKLIKWPFTEMLERRFFQITASVSLALIGLSFLLIYWQLFPEIRDQIFIPLHYNIHFGVDSLGPWWRIYTIPVLGSIILLTNWFVSAYLWKREKVLSYFFMGAALMSEVTLFVALIFVILLNLSYYG